MWFRIWEGGIFLHRLLRSCLLRCTARCGELRKAPSALLVSMQLRSQGSFVQRRWRHAGHVIRQRCFKSSTLFGATTAFPSPDIRRQSPSRFTSTRGATSRFPMLLLCCTLREDL